MNRVKLLRWLIPLLLAAMVLPVCGCGGASFDDEIARIAAPYEFNILSWEFSTLGDALEELVSPDSEAGAEAMAVVEAYFARVEEINSLRTHISAVDNTGGEAETLAGELEELIRLNNGISGHVESTIEGQLRELLADFGIKHPWQRWFGVGISFPPVNFQIEEPPHLLVISPRERIDTIREVTLLPGMTVDDMEAVEEEADGLGVSSLVVALGGFAGTYPTIVTSNSSLEFALATAAEEWAHQYLTFRPLGFRYLLDTTGIARNYEVATLNETAAGMVGDELAALILKKYYGRDLPEPEAEPETGFVFNREMRDIRSKVDALLAAGEAGKAEAYMEEKRLYLAEHGYHIRKLNQAYFAFHGAYADAPTTIDPIGSEMALLREQAGSLAAFLETAAALTSRDDLKRALE